MSSRQSLQTILVNAAVIPAVFAVCYTVAILCNNQSAANAVITTAIVFCPVLLVIIAADIYALGVQSAARRGADSYEFRSLVRPEQLQAQVDLARASFSKHDASYVSRTFSQVVSDMRYGMGSTCYFRCTRSAPERAELLTALADAGIRVEQRHRESCSRLLFLESCDCSTKTYDTFFATIAREHAD